MNNVSPEEQALIDRVDEAMRAYTDQYNKLLEKQEQYRDAAAMTPGKVGTENNKLINDTDGSLIGDRPAFTDASAKVEGQIDGSALKEAIPADESYVEETTPKQDNSGKVEIEFTDEDTIESIAIKLDEAVDSGKMTRPQADEMFERIGEELHLTAKERLEELKAENEKHKAEKQANVDRKSELSDANDLSGYDEAIRQIDEQIEKNDKEIEALEREVREVPKSLKLSPAKPTRSTNQLNADMERMSEALEKRQEELDQAKAELENYRKNKSEEKVEKRENVQYDVEQIYDGGKYYPSRPGEVSDEQIEADMMAEYLRAHPEMEGEDLVVIRGMGAMDDENGNIYEPYAIGRRVEKVVEDDIEQIYDGGKYYPSRPGEVSDEQIEADMMAEYLRTHPEMEGEDLVVIRGMGAMDDENGNIYEPYAIGRHKNPVAKEEKPVEAVSVEETPKVEEVKEEAVKEEVKTDDVDAAEYLRREIAELKKQRAELVGEEIIEKELTPEEKLDIVNEELSKARKEVQMLIDDYEESVRKTNEELANREMIEDDQLLVDLKDKKVKFQKEIKDARDRIGSLQDQKTELQTVIAARESLSPEETEAIVESLRDMGVVKIIMEEKGLTDIWNKKNEERTLEEKEQVANALREAMNRVADAKVQNRSTPVAELVQAIYFNDDKVEAVEPAREEEMASEEVKTLTKTARSLPERVVTNATEGPTYTPDSIPEDMKEVMESRAEDEYAVEQIYNEGKYYPSSPGEMSDEQIESEMMEEYLKSHPEMEGEDLAVIRGMGAMDDENGNVYEPYGIGRRVKKEKENEDVPVSQETAEEPSEENDLTTDQEPSVETVPADTDTEPTNTEEKVEDKSESKPKPKYIGRPAVDKILGDLTRDLPNDVTMIGAKEGDRFNAVNIRSGKSFFSELKAGGVDYNVQGKVPWAYKLVGALPVSLQHLLSKPIKALARFHFWRKPDLREAMEEVQERIDNLSPEELEVLLTEYKGSRVKEAKNMAINPMLFPRIRTYGLAKVEQLNDRMRYDYDAIFALVGKIVELEQKIEATPEDQRGPLLENREMIMSTAAGLVRDYIDCKKQANDILDGGIHGLSEDFKASKSKMNYEGLRFSKGHDLDTVLNAEIGDREQELNDAIALDDPETIVRSFLKHQKLYSDNTSVEKSFWGERSTGSKSFTPLAQEMSYSNDPFFRNLLTSIAIATTAIHTVDSLVKAHQARQMVAEHNAELRQVNDHNEEYYRTVQEKTEQIYGDRDVVQRGIEGQIKQDALNGINAKEIETLNKTGWRAYGPDYHAMDDAAHLEYNTYHADLTRRVEDVITRGATGKLSQSDTLHEMLRLGQESQEHLNGVLRKAWDVFEKWDSGHTFDHEAAIDSFRHILDNPNVIVEFQRAAIEHMDIAEMLHGLNIEYAAEIAALPNDVLSMLLADVGMVGLIGNATRDLRDRKTDVKRVDQSEIAEKFDEHDDVLKMFLDEDKENEKEEEEEHTVTR